MTNIESIIAELQELFNANEYTEAKELLLKSRGQSGIRPAEYAALSQLVGRIFYYEEDLEDAKRAFLEAIEHNPADGFSKVFLGRILERTGDTMTSLKIFAECYDEQAPFSHLGKKMQELGQSLTWTDQRLENLLKSTTKLPKLEALPKFSILVLGYNKASFTIRCLEAIFLNTDYPNYEVIVLDNASVDETPGILETYGNKIRFIHSNTNLGFVGGNNHAASFARGEYFVFLNNDTEPQPGWLMEIYKSFQRNPRAGAVGSMLLYPNGTLQEAGGAIFNDATGWNYGRNENPLSSRFRFEREVDYCSGAALAVNADLFRRLGGFDLRYAPAYFEDTDLCFSIRKLGYKVMFAPDSRVLHHEGITSGTDVTKGFKRFQVLNTPKFKEKWKDELRLQFPSNPNLRYLFSDRNRGKRILIIDDLPPLPDRAAGSLRLYHTVKQMLALGYKVTYVHLTALGLDDAAKKHMEEMRCAGVELIWFEYERWWEIRDLPVAQSYKEKLISSLELPLRRIDMVYICFWHIATHFVDLIRAAVPDLPIVVDSMDLHFLREARQAEIAKDAALKSRALETKKQELATYAKADCVTTVTERDSEQLLRELPDATVMIMTDVHDLHPTTRGFEERADFLFIGNFNHTPNEDAVVFFVHEIFSRIAKHLPEAKFWIVGNNPTGKVKALAGGNIIVTGWVPDVGPYLEKCRVTVVPLRYGAGNKGKVGETLAHGVPMVSTSVGAEGMNIIHDEHAFLSDDPKEFARLAGELYTNREKWEQFSTQGKRLVEGQYSSALMRQRIEYLTSFQTRSAFSSYRARRYATPPKASIVLLTHNQFSCTEQCLQSIRKYTSVSHETIVVDNASSDGTVKKIKKQFPEVRLIENSVNRGFPAAVNQGLNVALGKYIVLLNNDTIVTEGWLEQMIEAAEADPSIGIVGPMSNYISGPQLDKTVTYTSMEQMHRYARQVSDKHHGQVVHFPRIAFVCALIKREVVQSIGGLDERFSPGNFEDDDFCLRSVLAGFKTVIAQGVFVHHHGSKSFLADGKETYLERLRLNGEVFKQKWGVDHETLWTRKSEVRKRSTKVPLDRDRFAQYFSRAQLHIEEREMTLASDALDKAIAAFHTSERKENALEFPLVLNLAGNVALMLGDLEKARQFFEQQLTLLPQDASACVGLGEVFHQVGMYEAAKTMFEHAVINDGMNEDARVGLAKANHALGFRDDDNSLIVGEQEDAHHLETETEAANV